MSGTHAERIIRLLAGSPGLDDDAIAKTLGIEPRQTVNQVCRRLAARGVLRRERGPGGKILNRLMPDAPAVTPVPESFKPGTAHAIEGTTNRQPGRSLAPAELSKTLVIIPCAGAKQDRYGIGETGTCILQGLTPGLASELLAARERAGDRIRIDETTLIPAWKRYNGGLYEAGREALSRLMEAGVHVIILSGGYGAVMATEPIGMYDAVLKPSWWPNQLLERVLISYAREHRLCAVRAFCSATGPYRTILQRVRWRDADIEDALLLIPEPGPGAMRRSPASQGEALTALSYGLLTDNWRSSYDLRLDVFSA